MTELADATCGGLVRTHLCGDSLTGAGHVWRDADGCVCVRMCELEVADADKVCSLSVVCMARQLLCE